MNIDPVMVKQNCICNCEIKATPAEFRNASLWLKNTCQDLCIPEAQLSRLDLCLNEVLANILAHGGTTAVAENIVLSFNYQRLPELHKTCISISDAGIPFNPLLFVNQPLPKTLSEAVPGGLGLIMLQKLSDDIEYHYQYGRNHLTLTIYWLDKQ